MVDKIWYNMEELIGGSEERVLIETYWNVKFEMDMIEEEKAVGINRNILECKVTAYKISCSSNQVLIETYWNVKFEDISRSSFVVRVLIETYWNVKVKIRQNLRSLRVY